MVTELLQETEVGTGSGLGPEDLFLWVTQTWAVLEQGSWQCSRRGTQAFFTSSLKKCFLAIPTTLASFPKRTKAFSRSSSLSCGRDAQKCYCSQGR